MKVGKELFGREDMQQRRRIAARRDFAKEALAMCALEEVGVFVAESGARNGESSAFVDPTVGLRGVVSAAKAESSVQKEFAFFAEMTETIEQRDALCMVDISDGLEFFNDSSQGEAMVEEFVGEGKSFCNIIFSRESFLPQQLDFELLWIE